MAKNYFPAQDQSYTYLQTNRSDTLGSLWSTMGVDLQSDLNTLRVSPRMLVVANTAGLANLGEPTSFIYSLNQVYAVAGSRVFFSTTNPNSGWVEDTTTGVPTNCDSKSDFGILNGHLYLTANTTLYRKDAALGDWDNIGSLGISSISHAIASFDVFNRLYYLYDSNHVQSVDIDDNVSDGSYELDISDASYGNMHAMVANSTSIWISTLGTTSAGGQYGYILQWDGISAGLTKAYDLRSRFILSMCVYQDIVYAIDGFGILQRFNGYAFEEIGRLPFTNRLTMTSTFINRHGLIATKNGTILAMVNNRNNGATASYEENIPSGVWEWSKDFGFTHKYAIGYTPSGSSTVTDFGQNLLSVPGPILNIEDLFPSEAGRNGSILVGATYFTNASTTTNGFFIDDLTNTIIKKGYAVSTWFFSREVQDKWERLWATFRRLLTANDSIVFKYRIQEEDPLYTDITWVNTTSFTTTTNPTAYWTTGVGGEVEVLRGTGSGNCAHITSIVNNAGTYTVTLDTVITGVTTGTATVRFQKWIKLNPTVTGQVKSFAQLAIGASNPRIQIKACFTFTGNGEFYRFALFSNPDITITA